jgi:hypothetical protein
LKEKKGDKPLINYGHTFLESIYNKLLIIYWILSEGSNI